MQDEINMSTQGKKRLKDAGDRQSQFFAKTLTGRTGERLPSMERSSQCHFHQAHVHRHQHRGARPLERAFDSSLVGPSRKRTSSGGFALEIRRVQPSHLVRNAQTPARGRRMPGTCGTLPRHASESSRQQGVPQKSCGEAAGRSTPGGKEDPARILLWDAQ